MARLPLIDPETTSGDIRASFDRMPVKLNIFRMMAHAEANMIPAMRLGNSILHKQKLGAVNRELLILQAAQLEGGAYEWRQHVYIARDLGFTDADIERVAEGPHADGWSPIDAAMLRAVDELVADAQIADDTWAVLAGELDRHQLMDLVFTVGAYDLLAMAFKSFGVEIDADLAELT